MLLGTASCKSFGLFIATTAKSELSSGPVGILLKVALELVGAVYKIWILTENQRSNGAGVCMRFCWQYISFIGVPRRGGGSVG